MSYLETEEFRRRHEQLRITSGTAAQAHARAMLEIDTAAALAAGVSSTMGPEEFLEALPPGSGSENGDRDDSTDQDDHKG